MKNSLLLGSLLFPAATLISSCANAPQGYSKFMTQTSGGLASVNGTSGQSSQLAGKWEGGFGRNSYELQFRQDGTFSSSRTTTYGSKEIQEKTSGRWEIRSGRLYLNGEDCGPIKFADSNNYKSGGYAEDQTDSSYLYQGEFRRMN